MIVRDGPTVRPSPSIRRVWVIGPAGAAVVLLAACTGSDGGGSSGSPAPSSAAPSTQTSTSAGTSAPGSSGVTRSSSRAPATRTTAPATGTGRPSTGPVGTGSLSVVPTRPVRSAAPVPLRSRANLGGSVTARITNIRSTTNRDQGPGTLTGRPALTFSITLTNRSGAAVDTDTVGVEVVYGASRTPASPANQSSTKPFSGRLAPGRSATGTYSFAVPESGRNRLRVSVYVSDRRPIVVFQGSAR